MNFFLLYKNMYFNFLKFNILDFKIFENCYIKIIYSNFTVIKLCFY